MSVSALNSGSTALLTDHYELTMLQATLASGHADRPCVFEAFARRLPEGRRYGVVAGTGRFLDALGDTDERDIEALAGIWTAAVDAVMAWARAHPEESADDLTTRFTRLIDIVFSIGATR